MADKKSGWLIVLAAVTAFFIPARAGAPAEDVAARLDGQAIITRQDISDWQAHQPCYGPESIASRKAAFMRLFEARLAEAAMRSGGGPVITPAALKKEAARIDAETQAPDMLACIKKTLAEGERYTRAFLRPILAESLFRNYLMNDRKVQTGPLLKIKKARELLAAGGSFESAAAKTGLVYSSRTYSVSEPPAAGGADPADPAARWTPWEPEFINKYLKGLKPGEIRRETVETDYNLQLVRFIKSGGNKWFFESLLVTKTSQEELFGNMKKGKLEVFDAEIKEWLLSIKGNPRLSAVEIK
jgi:hypothetical protein